MPTKLLVLIISMLITGSVISATQTGENLDDEFKSLDGRVQSLKKEVLEINRDL